MGFKFNPFTGNLDISEKTSPAGLDTQVQFNDGGSFGGDAGMTYNKTTNELSLTGPLTAKNLNGASIGDELITLQTDRDFSGAGNWTGTNWAVSGGKLVHTAGLYNATLSTYPATIGKKYLITMTVATTSGGVTHSMAVSYGGTTAEIRFGKTAAITLTAVQMIVVASTTDGIVLTPTASWAGNIDDVSIKEIIQATPSVILKNESDVISVEVRSVNSTSGGIGINALSSTTTGYNNTAVGVDAGNGITTGYSNTAVGCSTLKNGTQEYNSTAVGCNALLVSSKGNNNTAIGCGTLTSNINGTSNTAVGCTSLSQNVNAYANTAVGDASMQENRTGVYNTAVGYAALNKNQAGGYNAAVGNQSLFYSKGSYNTAIGDSAALTTSTGGNNTAIGANSLRSNDTGSRNVCLGYYSGSYETGSDAFYVDNRDRTNTAGEKAGALLYGTFNATPNLQTLAINASLSVLASFRTGFSALTTNTTLDTTHSIVTVTGTITITLPTAANIAGRQYTVKNIGIGVITVATTSSQTVDGAAPENMITQWTSRTYCSDGANWILI